MRRVSRSRESAGSRDRSLRSAATSLSRRRTASVRRQGDSAPGPRLGEVVAERLTELGADPEDAQWDSRKHGDGSWQVQLAFRAGGRLHIAEWLFDPRRRHVLPADDNASRLSLPEAELPPPTGGSLGAATVTPIRPRPDRSQPAPPPEPVMEPAEEPARAAAQAAAPGSFAPSRAPIGRPPSHAAPQPGNPRMPMSDDEPNGTGRGPAHRPGGAGRPAPGQGADDRNAGRTPAAATGSPAAQDRTEPSPAAQPTAAAQAAPEGRTAPGPQGRPAADTDTGAAAAPPAPSAERSPRPERAATERAATERAATERAATGQAATGQAGAATATDAQAPAAPAAGEPGGQGARSADNGRPQAPDQPPPALPADEAPARGRGKKAAGPRGRRASVPSWDEIMLGNSRQPE